MKRNIFLDTVLICIAIFLGCRLSVSAQETTGRILFISSYSYAWDTVQLQIEGIKAGVEPHMVVDYEFMDTKRVDDEISYRQFYEGLSYRMSQLDPYDVVILGDDAALRFALEYQEELFKDIPLVFEGINDEELAVQAAGNPMITGIVEKLSVEKNIELALKLNPKAQRVVAILDDTTTGKATRKQFYACQSKYPDMEFDEINTSQLTADEFKDKVRFLGNRTILIFVVMTEDADGRPYTNAEAVKMIVENAKIPVMQAVDSQVDGGLLGGNMVSMVESGKRAGQIATDIINGQDISELKVELELSSPNIYRIDESVMRSFNLNLKEIPEEAEILHHKESFWERNEQGLKFTFVFAAAFLCILSWIVYDNLRKQKLVKQMETSNKNLENVSQHDVLTGLCNRSKFMKDLEENISLKIPTTIMMLDIDDFKNINDSYGHAAGDEVLQQVGERLRKMQSQILTAYRYAGDEFILILRSAQSNLIEKTAYDCRQVFAGKMVIRGDKKNITGSIGIATYPKDSLDQDELIVCADHAMYQVKKNGKNDFAFYKGREAEE